MTQDVYEEFILTTGPRHDRDLNQDSFDGECLALPVNYPFIPIFPHRSLWYDSSGETHSQSVAFGPAASGVSQILSDTELQRYASQSQHK